MASAEAIARHYYTAKTWTTTEHHVESWGTRVSETDLIGHFFLRAISGAVALVAGTGLCYVLFIGGFLRRIEQYKQRLEVYKRLDKYVAEMIVTISGLRRRSELVDDFSRQTQAFNEYVNGEDRLFMSAALKRKCRNVIRASEQLMPDEYPEPPGTVEYPEPKLLNLEDAVKAVRKTMEDEIEGTRFGVPTELVGFWSRMKRGSRYRD
jgi:hypothetical protein